MPEPRKTYKYRPTRSVAYYEEALDAQLENEMDDLVLGELEEVREANLLKWTAQQMREVIYRHCLVKAIDAVGSHELNERDLDYSLDERLTRNSENFRQAAGDLIKVYFSDYRLVIGIAPSPLKGQEVTVSARLVKRPGPGFVPKGEQVGLSVN